MSHSIKHSIPVGFLGTLKLDIGADKVESNLSIFRMEPIVQGMILYGAWLRSIRGQAMAGLAGKGRESWLTEIKQLLIITAKVDREK